MPATPSFNLEPDLATGVVPISSAASSLAALIRRATASRRPIAITQKGVPTGLIISVDLYAALRAAAELAAEGPALPEGDA